MKTIAALICAVILTTGCVLRQQLRAEPPESYDRAPNGAM